jgi:hypothetical protein
MQLQQNNELGIYAQPEPEQDQTMAASVWGKSNTSGDIGQLPSTSAMSPRRQSRSDSPFGANR